VTDDLELFAPRTVRPRTRRYKRLPVVALDRETARTETGETGFTADIPELLPAMDSALFAMVGAADWLASISPQLAQSYPDTWQYGVSSHERGIIRPDGLKVAARVTMVIHQFGFKGGNYHKIIDPVSMYGHKLDVIWPGPEDRIVRLLKWAVAIRDFCDENQMEVRPTIGGISAQFLTDRRFYSGPRRKVPRAINERARHEQPGNHYALAVLPSPRQEFTASYLDQHRAHHYHARTTPLPDANSLYAFGRFTDLEEITFTEPQEGFHGLYCLDLCAPASEAPKFDWINWRTKAFKQGRNFVFSNELPHLLDMGYTVNGVRAAWGSFERDTGLPKYATFANQQLDKYGSLPWIKPLLLATYGTLATKAGYGERIYRLAKRGQPVEVLTGHHTLPGLLVRRANRLEPGIANVIHRGMIEAACRSESVGLAQWLEHEGYRVLSIYADAVIVRQDEGQCLPEIPEPWRLKSELTHLQFINKQAFISGEMTKLPGVSRELRDYTTRGTTRTKPRKFEALTGKEVF
jgi:hypothetical protein